MMIKSYGIICVLFPATCALLCIVALEVLILQFKTYLTVEMNLKSSYRVSPENEKILKTRQTFYTACTSQNVS